MTVVTSALGEHVAMNEKLICLMWRGRRGGGGVGKRRDLGPRIDVLTTCKAVTLRGGQRVIGVFR